MSQSVAGMGPTVSAVCEEATECYRSAGKRIQSPSIRKVLESIIRQKSAHVDQLRALDAQFAGAVKALVPTESQDPLDILKCIVKHEQGFAATMDEFAVSISDEETRHAVKAIADASRKFASWAQDHLDLLAMF